MLRYNANFISFSLRLGRFDYIVTIYLDKLESSYKGGGTTVKSQGYGRMLELYQQLYPERASDCTAESIKYRSYG